MADKKKEPKLTEAEKEHEAAARGETDVVQLTNGSGERKDVSPSEWESSEAMLRADGWIVMGEEAE